MGEEYPYPFLSQMASMRRLALSSRRGSSDRPRRTLTTFAPLMLASIRTLGGRFLDDPVHDEFRPDAGAAIYSAVSPSDQGHLRSHLKTGHFGRSSVASFWSVVAHRSASNLCRLESVDRKS